MDTVTETFDAEIFRQHLSRLWGRVYEPVAPLGMEAWASQEPLGYADRRSGRRIEPKIGEAWGEALFDCAWFRFHCDLPADVEADSLYARIDINGELLVVGPEGEAIRGLTNKKSEFARSHGLPGKEMIQLEARLLQNGRVDFWADAAFNDLFGGVQGEGRIEVAELCAYREDIRGLYYDFEVLIEVLEELAVDTALCARVFASLEKAWALVDAGFEASQVAEARACLASFFEPSSKTDSLKVSAVGHGHLDLAWLWPIRESKRKGVRTLATALANAALYPEHLYGCSQPQLFLWIKETDPELYQRVKAGVRDGDIELQGKFWVEPDCNIPNGESYIRQVLQGARFFKEEFGQVPDQCWQPDVFGYNGQLPQILKKTGHDAFMTQKLSWNMINRFPYHSFRWEGIDGSRIPTHMLPEETYNGPAAPRSLRKIRDEYAQREVSGHALMVFGIGDGGGGPGREHLERLRRLSAFESLPEVEIRPTAEFFADWIQDVDRFPVWTGELYLEKHQGTLTTQARTKRNNRRCEILLREAELLSVIAWKLAGRPYPREELDTIWREVLLYQFHDILPGSSIKRVYNECTPRYAALIERLETLVAEAAADLGAGGALQVINTQAWPRREWLPHAGRWYRVEAAACASAALQPLDAQELEDGVLLAEDGKLVNDRIRVSFAADGRITSIVETSSGTDFVDSAAGAANDFVMIADQGDAWDYAADVPQKDVWLYLREPVTRPELLSREYAIDGPEASVTQVFRVGEHSTIRQRVLLRSGEDQVEFETEVDWQEEAHMLRVRFPLSVQADEAKVEIPFGSLSRPVHEEDSFSKAQFEVPAQQWVALTTSDRSAALYNDCKYGFRLKDKVIDMALIRSVPHPNAAVITVDDSGTSGQTGKVYTDLGVHEFRYALQVRSGGITESELTRRARAFNQPLRFAPVVEAGGPLNTDAWLSIGDEAVELIALKQAEDGHGFVVRLANVSPKPVDCALTMRLPHTDAESVSMAEVSEERIVAIQSADGGKTYDLSFGRFEVKTLRFNC